MNFMEPRFITAATILLTVFNVSLVAHNAWSHQPVEEPPLPMVTIGPPVTCYNDRYMLELSRPWKKDQWDVATETDDLCGYTAWGRASDTDI